MVKSIINVSGMSCEHCVKAITKAVSALPGISSVSVNLKAKTVTVEHDPALSPLDKIKLEIEDQGYDIIK
jgi:copper chaperone